MDNASYTNKLQTTLIEAGKAVERSQASATPLLEELDGMYNELREAVKNGDMMKQVKATKAMTAALIKWQIEKL